MMKKNKQAIVRRMQYTPSNLHIREASGDREEPSRTITGYAILFGVPSEPLWKDEESEAREIIDPSAISKELLDGSDIKFTMFHDRQLILARSKNGTGTLTYNIDEKGVSFEFEAPNTIDGDKALELVKRGDISGCSFAFSTHYYDDAFVSRDAKAVDGYTVIIYTVRQIIGIYDFTLASDPAYSDTTVETEQRSLVDCLKKTETPEEIKSDEKKMRDQVSEMRRAAASKII